MGKSSPSVSIFEQTPTGPKHLFLRVVELLSTTGLERFRAAVAYARWDGIGLIAPQIEKLLGDGGEFQSIYGVANGITTADSLLYGLYLQELYSTHTYAGAIEDKYANSIFHPKFFEFRFPETTVVILGSANLTGGGFVRNTELGVEVCARRGDAFEKQAEAAWKSMRAGSEELTLSLVRKLQKQMELASELDKGESRSDQSKPKLAAIVKASPKPLFKKVLALKEPATRSKIFSKMDTLSVRPKRLYLQILKYETGGQGNSKNQGYQIQLPVGTLATFFGVGQNESKEATFRFPNEMVKVHLTHFGNNTHRLRLRPLQSIARPAVVIFERVGSNDYKCSIVPAKDYVRTLARKCKEQTRTGARKWGLE
ncbi:MULTISPECIES: phospholipase D family protein [unclassified Bradyrhizobium]|uniref:phospholipase D family protein n=1 Tax=unclassified Bradyrhizobium TaxID=2631580 RepID=UPI001FF9A810|nr:MULTISPECIES: phospholipase D family protein [unclassified Bradyrhizobium]MCK1715215.1 phospholipase D family protein [Bradyrhizobium sp. 143]MCK1725436.1 phospholipase D family protein [Bradyrhizobium sp. 142]